MLTKEILKQVRQIEIKTKGLVNQVFSGEYHSVFKGRGMEFSEVREYQFGDDIRSIDWNVTARLGHPYIKIFEEERELTVMMLVDLSGSLIFGSVDKTKQQIAAELSAILAFSALKNSDKVGLILFTDKIEKFVPPRKGRKHVLRIIREVLSFEPEGKSTNIKAALEFMNKAIEIDGNVYQYASERLRQDHNFALNAVKNGLSGSYLHHGLFKDEEILSEMIKKDGGNFFTLLDRCEDWGGKIIYDNIAKNKEFAILAINNLKNPRKHHIEKLFELFPQDQEIIDAVAEIKDAPSIY